MRPDSRWTTILAALLATLGSVAITPAAAQAPPLRDLPAPAKVIEDPFSMITGALELGGGRVLMVDAAELDLVLVDFDAGTRTVIGRKGSGPGEYRAPGAMIRGPGDTIWIVDAAQMRITGFMPDLKPGPTIPFMVFDQSTGTALTAPMMGDRSGRVYASAMVMSMGQQGGNMQMAIPDSVTVVRRDPRDDKSRAELAKVRFPTSGRPEMKQLGPGAFKYTMAYPGLVAADAWAVFPDGRVAIVRGGSYMVEFIMPDGRRVPPVRVTYDPIPVTAADRAAEMEEAQRLMKEQAQSVQKMMPANVTMEFELLPPVDWPATYPAVAPLGAFAAANGDLWVRRAIPVRQGREQWDVLDPNGRLVARWRLPAKTTVIGVGTSAVYTARTDEDDFRYAQRVDLPRRP